MPEFAAASMTDRDARIAVVGPIPPPVTGRTVVTERLVEHLVRANVVHSLTDTAVSVTGSVLRRKLWRAVSLLLYAGRIVTQTRGASTTYITVDASPGTIFTILYLQPLASARGTVPERTGFQQPALMFAVNPQGRAGHLQHALKFGEVEETSGGRRDVETTVEQALTRGLATA